MAEQAAHLVDRLMPRVPVRWVLTLPHRLRYRLAYDHALSRGVVAVAMRAVLAFYRGRGVRVDVRAGRSGAVTVIQRFDDGVQLNVHFHSLVIDGVFAEGADGRLVLYPAEPPTDQDVARLLAAISRRVCVSSGTAGSRVKAGTWSRRRGDSMSRVRT